MTVISIALWATALYATREIDTWLASIAKTAMQRAGLTQDYVARVTGIPPNKLSEQLAGQRPFTGLVRFGCQEMREDTVFWEAFADVLAARLDRVMVPRDLGALVAGVEELVRTKRRMVKAALPKADAVQEAV